MKRPQLKQLIREEVKVALKEAMASLKQALKEASFTDQMNPDTRKLYGEYIQNIDIFDRDKINNHQKLSDVMNKDPRVQKNSQKRLLLNALGWAITFAQEMER